VYSVADVLLALLAGALLAVALAAGSSRVRAGILFAAGVALVFTLHALSVPPSNGAVFLNPIPGASGYVPRAPSAGLGETLALCSLAAAIGGLGLSLLGDWPGVAYRGAKAVDGADGGYRTTRR